MSLVFTGVQSIQYLDIMYRQKVGVDEYQVSTACSVSYSQDSDSVQAVVWCVRVNRQYNIKCDVKTGVWCY